MVIRHQNRHPQLFRMRNLIDGRNTVVAGDDRVHPLFIRRIDQMLVDAVAVTHAVGNRAGHTAAASCDPLIQNIGRHHAVDVVISNDPDRSSLPYLF